jgi:hypothetical protein
MAAMAVMAPSTAAAPDMSVFIVLMPWAVFSDSPPESNVMPFPTNATVGVSAVACGGSYNSSISRGGSSDPRATPSRPPSRAFSAPTSSSTVTTSPAAVPRSTATSARRSGVRLPAGSLMRSRANRTARATTAPRAAPAAAPGSSDTTTSSVSPGGRTSLLKAVKA